MIVADNWAARLLRTQVFARVAAFAMRRKLARKLAFATLSQTGIAYRQSALSRTTGGLPKDAPRPGERFPWLSLVTAQGEVPQDLFRQLDDTRFNLLVFGQPAPAALPLGRELLCVHAFPAAEHNARELTRAHVPQTSFWLLRPDGHIGLAGTRLTAAELAAYCASIHLRGPGVALPKAAIGRTALSAR
jgi:hypothetical protein